jgi:hypothetical protein
MKLIIDIPEEGLNACKLWVKLGVADWRDKVIVNGTPIKTVTNVTPIESITTKGGMTLSLKKPDIEIPDLARCIAMALNDTTVEEFANKYNMLTFIDNNSGKSVSYRRVDNIERGGEENG